jgi:hypothetical protein
VDEKLAGPEGLQDKSTHELITKEKRADHTGKDQIIVKVAFIGANKDDEERVVEHRPGSVGGTRKPSTHQPQREADRYQRDEVGKSIKVHRSKRPEHTGVAGVRVIILRQNKNLELFMIIIELPPDIPSNFLPEPHREPGKRRLKVKREGLRRTEQ